MLYDTAICNLDLQWAIENAWSVPPRCKIAKIEGLDLSNVSVSGEDFNQKELQAAVEKEAYLHRVALITAMEREGQTVVFCPSVASSKGVCHYLNNNYGVPAVFVYGTMPDEERVEALRKFKSHEAQVLVNCQVVAVGFDHPPTMTLILARPTRSRSFWLQCAGRATRALAGVVDFEGSTAESRAAAIAASKKPYFKIIDCTDSTLDHRLITAVDMFVSASEDIKKEVRKRASEASEPLSTEELEALAQIELEKKRLAQEIEARRLATQGRATGRLVGRDVDLTSGGKRCVGTYTNPLRGKYGGQKMSDLPDNYISWACQAPTIKGWVKSLFVRERSRRDERRRERVSAGRHESLDRGSV
jgi:superfamily II DNA or RNA helicase